MKIVWPVLYRTSIMRVPWEMSRTSPRQPSWDESALERLQQEVFDCRRNKSGADPSSMFFFSTLRSKFRRIKVPFLGEGSSLTWFSTDACLGLQFFWPSLCLSLPLSTSLSYTHSPSTCLSHFSALYVILLTPSYFLTLCLSLSLSISLSFSLSIYLIISFSLSCSLFFPAYCLYLSNW